MPMTRRHDNEWGIVLGASTGAGAAIASALARDSGLHVLGFHRGNHPEDAAAVQTAVEAAGRRCVMRVGEAGTAASATAAAEELAELVGPGRVRVLVHSIADASYGRFTSHDGKHLHPKQFAKTFERMAHSFVYWTQALLDHDLLAPGARIVGLTNPIVDSDVVGWGLVSAAKAALETYVRLLAAELGPRGYCVLLVKFGLVETRAIRMAFTDDEWARVKADISRATPARRLCTVDEVGALVAALTGPLGEWFNGATVDYTGAQVRSLLDRVFNRDGEERIE